MNYNVCEVTGLAKSKELEASQNFPLNAIAVEYLCIGHIFAQSISLINHSHQNETLHVITITNSLHDQETNYT